MIFHIVLFRPGPDLAEHDRQMLVQSFERALAQIPSVRRAHVGRRVTHGHGYEAAMTQDLPFAAVIEFDNLAGLQAYLRHPAHEELGTRFMELLDVGLIYDYEMTSPTGLETLRGES